jgi:hypothetical protein
MIVRCLRNGVLAAGLLWPVASTRAEEVEVLPFDAMWDWLMILQPGSSAQVDPVLADPDFLETWTTSAYEGPAFERGAAPLSYGGITFLMSGNAPPGTEMMAPAAGTRGTVYFRTAFDLTGDLTDAKLEVLVDDGFILYLDGVRWTAMNMPPGATSAFSQLAAVVADEASLSILLTGTTIPRGHHTLHISVHNANFVSTDLGFMLRLTGDLHPVPNPTLKAEAAAPSIDGSPRFKLRAQGLNPEAAVVVEESSDLTHWTPLFTSPPAAGRSEFALDLPAIAGRKFFRLAE